MPAITVDPPAYEMVDKSADRIVADMRVNPAAVAQFKDWYRLFKCHEPPTPGVWLDLRHGYMRLEGVELGEAEERQAMERTLADPGPFPLIDYVSRMTGVTVECAAVPVSSVTPRVTLAGLLPDAK